MTDPEKSSAASADERWQIEWWLAEMDTAERATIPGHSALFRAVRAALEIIDIDHYRTSNVGHCRCGRKWPCIVKAEHEQKLLEAIRG